jgi:hypothetical protein
VIHKNVLTLICWALMFGGCVVSTAQTRTPVVESLDVSVLQAPVIVNVGGKRHLVYELHLTNLRSTDVAVSRVEVLDASDANSKSIGNFRDVDLQNALGGYGSDSRVVSDGMRAIFYAWLPLDEASAPTAITHRIEFDVIRSATDRKRVVMQTQRAEVRKDTTPLVLGSPLQGGPWQAIYDPSVERGHRRVFYTIDGRARIPGRFAIDWMKLGKDQKLVHGDETKIANWHGYSANVLAVADATVADAKDDIAESPSIVDPPEHVSLENASGNYIALDLGGGRYAFYEHLKPGSLRVKAGDRVKRGAVIAALGNTGSSSSGPHLHFHVADANSLLGAEGVPYVLDRQGGLPTPNAVVRFD